MRQKLASDPDLTPKPYIKLEEKKQRRLVPEMKAGSGHYLYEPMDFHSPSETTDQNENGNANNREYKTENQQTSRVSK